MYCIKKNIQCTTEKINNKQITNSKASTNNIIKYDKSSTLSKKNT